MWCPNCKEPLLVLEFEGIELDYCDSCRGVWLDPDEVAMVFGNGGWQKALHVAPGEVLKREGGKACPRCRTTMHKRLAGEKHPVTTDLCPRGHGLWLDGGELGALIEQSHSDPVFQRLSAWLGNMLQPAKTIS